MFYLPVLLLHRDFNHAVESCFEIALDIGVLHHIEKCRERSGIKLVGEAAAFRGLRWIADLKQVSNAGSTPITPIRIFETSVTLGVWPGITGMRQERLIAFGHGQNQVVELIDAENPVGDIRVDVGVSGLFEE